MDEVRKLFRRIDGGWGVGAREDRRKEWFRSLILIHRGYVSWISVEKCRNAQEQWKRKHGDEISWFRDFSFRFVRKRERIRDFRGSIVQPPKSIEIYHSTYSCNRLNDERERRNDFSLCFLLYLLSFIIISIIFFFSSLFYSWTCIVIGRGNYRSTSLERREKWTESTCR